MQFLSLLAGASVLLTPVLAQTWTACNPMNASLTCPPDPALGLNHTFYFNTSTAVDQAFNVTAGTLNYGNNGAEFTIAQKGDSPTIQSQFYIFFGSVSVIMRAAPGQGIISSIVLQSDDLDEVDWEFIGGNATYVETNYFGKGNLSSYDRAVYYPVSSDTRDNFHNYTTHWTAEKLEWYIDGALVRTLPYAAADGGYNYPQTPMTVRLGIWAGGDPTENQPGTVEWAGGVTDYSKGPFTMYVQSATVNDFSTGKEYVYSDHSGSWQSIKTIAGNSTVAHKLTAPPPETIAQKWAKLPTGAKLAVYCSAGGVAALALSVLLFTCIRQRRAGRREREAYNAKVEKERDDAYRDQMELREKGLGGWDNSTQGEDALGGWGGSHSGSDDEARAPLTSKGPNISSYEVPSPSRSTSPGLSRMASPGPVVLSPQPQSAHAWAGDNQSMSGGGGYGNNSNTSPRSPTFPLTSQSPQYGSGSSKGGYHRF